MSSDYSPSHPQKVVCPLQVTGQAIADTCLLSWDCICWCFCTCSCLLKPMLVLQQASQLNQVQANFIINLIPSTTNLSSTVVYQGKIIYSIFISSCLIERVVPSMCLPPKNLKRRWTRSNPRAQNPVHVSHESGRDQSSTWGIACYLQECALARSWKEEKTSWTETQALTWDTGIPKWQLNFSIKHLPSFSIHTKSHRTS